MKITAATLLLAASVMASTAAFAQMTTDDLKWVNRCLSDNAGATVSREVVRKYCVCMNNKMSDNETLSISAWEKTHPAERRACDRESGWR